MSTQPSGKGPIAIIRQFAYQQDLVFAEDHTAHIQLGGGITGLGFKNWQHLAQISFGFGSHDLRSDVAQFLISLGVKRILGVLPVRFARLPGSVVPTSAIWVNPCFLFQLVTGD